MPMQDPTPKRRPRVSLLSLLLLTTIVALGLSLSLVYRDNQRLASDNVWLLAQNNKLVYDASGLEVEDQAKIYAKRVVDHEKQRGVARLIATSGSCICRSTALTQSVTRAA